MGFDPFRAILNNLEKNISDRPGHGWPGWPAGSPTESCQLMATYRSSARRHQQGIAYTTCSLHQQQGVDRIKW